MADTLDVITLAQAKAALDISAGVTTYDIRLAGFVTAVSRRLDQLCGPVVQRSVTETFDGSHWPWRYDRTGRAGTLFLTYKPVVSITSLSDTATVLDPSTYTFVPSSGMVRKVTGVHVGFFSAGVQTVSITYVAGRFADTASVQEPFTTAAGMLLAHMWRPEHGVSSEFSGSDNFQVLPGYFLPNVVRGLLGDEIQPLIGIA